MELTLPISPDTALSGMTPPLSRITGLLYIYISPNNYSMLKLIRKRNWPIIMPPTIFGLPLNLTIHTLRINKNVELSYT